MRNPGYGGTRQIIGYCHILLPKQILKIALIVSKYLNISLCKLHFEIIKDVHSMFLLLRNDFFK